MADEQNRCAPGAGTTSQGRVTMKDIASHVGVSINTVHKALTGKPGVSDKTRTSILTYADEMGYRRNESASSLHRKEANIAICLPGASGDGRYFYAYAWDGCHRFMHESRDAGIRYEQVEFNYDEYPERLEQILERVHAGERLDGMLAMAPINPRETRLLRSIANEGVPIELFNGEAPDTGCIGTVIANYSSAGNLMAEQICNLLRGCADGARVVLLSGDPYTDSHYRVARAFHNYLATHAPQIEAEDVPGAHAQADALRHALVGRLRANAPQAICSAFAAGSEVMCDALLESRLAGQIPAIGSDLFPENVEAMKRGILTNIVYKDPAGLAYRAIKTLCERVLWGTDPKEPLQIGPVELVFSSNLSQYCADASVEDQRQPARGGGI